MTAATIDLIHELVSSAARAVPDRVAVIAPDGEPTTFAEFDRQVRALAAWISGLTRTGDRVAVIADNGADFARLYYAVPRSGRILTLINQRLSPAEQSMQLAATEPTILVGDPRYLAAQTLAACACIHHPQLIAHHDDSPTHVPPEAVVEFALRALTHPGPFPPNAGA